MSLAYVTLSELTQDGSAANLNGTAVITASVTVYSSGVPVLIPNVPINAQVINGQLKNASGGALTLLATDNAGLAFEGQSSFFFYQVTLTLSGQVQPTWYFQLPSSPATRDLFSLANTAAMTFANPMTTPGDLIAGGTSGAPQRLAGDTSNTRKLLRTQSVGGVAQVPAWDTLVSGDIPNNAANTSGNAATATNLAGGAALPAYLAPAVVALSQSGGNVAVNAAAGNDFRLTLTASGWTIANPTSPVDGQDITITLTQDSTGSRTVTWGVGYYFGAAGAPVLSTAAGVADVIAFKYLAAAGLWEFLGSTSSLAVPVTGGTMTGQLTVPDLAVSGLTGATAASRYAGATASGAPASGTFAIGDFTVDQTGKIWVCTTAGTPGTWTQIGGGGGGGSNGGVTATALGLAIASFRPGLTAGSNSSGNGVIFAALATAVTSTPLTKLGINLQTAGATPGANANGLAVYSEAGSLLRQTGDMTTAFQGTGWVEGTLTSSLAITAGTNYYLVISASFTTAPQYTGVVNGGAGLLGLNGHYLGGFISNAGFPASFAPSSFGNLNTPPAIYGR